MTPEELRLRKSIRDERNELLWEVEIDPPGATGYGNIRFLLFTEHYKKIVGVGHEEWAGLTVFEAINEPSATAVHSKYAQCVREKRQIAYSEYLNLVGRWRYWRTTLEPLINADGEVYRLIGTSEEIVSVEAELRNAIAASTLEVHYQPICDLQTLEPIGYEALVRWPGTGRGPNDFLPIAKAAGIMDQITNLVLRDSAKTAARLPNDLWVAVNVNDGSFEEALPRILSAQKLEPQKIRFEITEDTHLNDEILASFKRVAIMGHLMELDDFGTQGANLEWLSKINFYALKLDAQFVVEAWKYPNKAAICRGAVQIALEHNPPLSVVAEGIESEADKEFAQSIGIKYGQGFLLGRPGPLPAIPAS